MIPQTLIIGRVGEEQKGRNEEEEKFEFAEDVELFRNNHKPNIVALEKIDEENYPLRNRVKRLYQSTNILNVQTDRIETGKKSKIKMSSNNTL